MRMRTHTKKGPGRLHKQGSDSARTMKSLMAGQFARDLRAWITNKAFGKLAGGAQ